MDKNSTITGASCDISNRPHICWSAIFAGAIVGLGLGFLLQLYGIAIGLSAYSSSTVGATTIAVGGLIGLFVGVIISMGVAGYVTGYLGRFHYGHCHGGVIYGFVTWGIALLLSAIFFLPLSHYAAEATEGMNSAEVVKHYGNLAQSVDATAKNVSVTSKNEKTAINQSEIKISPRTLTGSSWIVFGLFFIGALASCIGACCGMGCRKTDPYANRTTL